MPRRKIHGKPRLLRPVRPAEPLSFCFCNGGADCTRAGECEQECQHSRTSRRLNITTADGWRACQKELYRALVEV